MSLSSGSVSKSILDLTFQSEGVAKGEGGASRPLKAPRIILTEIMLIWSQSRLKSLLAAKLYVFVFPFGPSPTNTQCSG